MRNCAGVGTQPLQGNPTHGSKYSIKLLLNTVRYKCSNFCMRKRNQPLSRVGNELVSAAQTVKLSASELLTQLFPYVWEASRRMSTRGISRWLDENHGLEISHTSVSRALRQSEQYWQDFAEFIEPSARIAADAANVDIKTVLLDESLLEHLVKVPELSGETQEELADNYQELGEAVTFLKDNWFALGKPLRNMCSKYFSNEEEETK